MGTDSQNDYYHPVLRAAEETIVQKRRSQCGVPVKDPKVGVALSGGGIRSATFCLGVFQSLAAKGFLPKIDFLSTVSGGGYFGSFLGRLFDVQPGGENHSIEGVKEILTNPLSSSIKWLREHGRYLSPHGPMDNLIAGLVFVRNWAAVQAVILSFGLWAIYCILILGCAVQMGTDYLTLSIPISSILFPAALFFLFWLVPMGLGYWLCQGEGGKAVPLAPIATLLTIGVVGVFIAMRTNDDPVWRSAAGAVSITVGMTVFLLVCFLTYSFLKKKKSDTAEFLRTRFTLGFIQAACCLGVILFLALVDGLGNFLYDWMKDHSMKTGAFDGSALLAGAWVFLAGLGKKVSGLFTETQKFIPKLSTRAMAGLAAAVWLLAILAVLTGFAEILSWGFPATMRQLDEQILVSDWVRLLEVFVCLTLLCLGLGKTISFLNYSSNHPFYRNRLVDAYLGSANTTGDNKQAVSKGSNDVWMRDYTPYLKGGPLHFINVTINETVDGKSQVEERDRKGVPMAIGPAGLTVGTRHHCLWREKDGVRDFGSLKPLLNSKNEFHVFGREAPGFLSKAFNMVFRDGGETDYRSVEYLSLGAWFSISGAAFTTGLGSKTSIALSSLLGLANIRLGYWWNSHVSSTGQSQRSGLSLAKKISLNLSGSLPVQFGLLDELTARFHGTSRQRWYLSDGGHFENTACYELIRRRVPFIVVCDDGQDVDYGFEDLAGLVLKARNDFQAEITFFGPGDLEKNVHPVLLSYIGSLNDFKNKGSQKHALLAWVEYPKSSGENGHSLMLILKPSISGDESLDLLEYQRQNPDFPQETTMNQFFTETQWEGYRKLGEHIAGKIFNPIKAGKGWTPAKGNIIPKPTGE